jgi:hypothetical protein
VRQCDSGELNGRHEMDAAVKELRDTVVASESYEIPRSRQENDVIVESTALAIRCRAISGGVRIAWLPQGSGTAI